MIDLNNIERVYLIGIGGIGMSGLARYFYHKGLPVAGYDKTYTVLTRSLEAEGIAVSYQDEATEIPVAFQNNDAKTLIIYTPAIPGSSRILAFFKTNGFTIYKRSQILGFLSKDSYAIAVAGTHGKTTTSTLIAHLLKVGGIDCSAFLGGIATNYDSNLLVGESKVMVLEADEYDRSFLTLHPDVAIVTSMDADHLDIYGGKEQLHESFVLFIQQLKEHGKLIYREGLPLENGKSYGVSTTAKAKAFHIRIEDARFYFDFQNEYILLEDLTLGLPGEHNIENAVAAIEVALTLDINPTLIREGLASFKGVKRRFEYHVQTEQHIYIDDYAHHPEELRACFAAIRAMYPEKKMTVVFQPHLFSRTRDFLKEFAEVLDTVDQLVLLEIYPARELPIDGVSSDALAKEMSAKNVIVCAKDELLDIINAQQPELLLTVGAGDIDTLVLPLKESFIHV